MTKRVLFLVGPTGSGKTQLSVHLAKRLGAEIVAADSMQVYRGMDIGTAKPSRSEQRQVPYHLIDLVSPRRNFSVYEHRQRALKTIEAILKRGKLPLVVGGGGLYVTALWKGLSPHPGASAQLRGELDRIATREGVSHLYEDLQALDPDRARQIHPHDRRRIVRALEIAKSSGRSPSEWYRTRTSLEELGYSVKVIGIARDRTDLYERIRRRAKSMFRQGWVREVERLKRGGLSKTARQALGYREILESLTRMKNAKGARSLLKERVQRRTRQFAKRQLTWFRREKEIQWFRWEKGESVREVCGKIIVEIEKWLESGSSL